MGELLHNETGLFRTFLYPETFSAFAIRSPHSNRRRSPGYDFIDKIFTVYDKNYINARDVNINCGAKSCLTCHKCYVRSKTKYINEKLK